MSRWTPESDSLRELAQLPASDPRRRGLEDRLASMDPVEAQYWSDVLKQTDQIYAQLANDSPPAGLIEKLLTIPDSGSQSWWRRAARQPVTWQHLAAGFLLILGLLAMVVWLLAPTTPPGMQTLNKRLANQIAQMAIDHHAGNVQIEDHNPDAVAAALAKQPLDFSPTIPHPAVHLTLVGGGVFKYDSAPVAFTRWTGNGIKYTLYQFNSKQLGLPVAFAGTSASIPSSPGERVNVWPTGDGTTAMALVLESPAATDVFSDGCH